MSLLPLNWSRTFEMRVNDPCTHLNLFKTYSINTVEHYTAILSLPPSVSHIEFGLKNENEWKRDTGKREEVKK